MPQMSPMWWTSLVMYFTVIMAFIMSTIYFNNFEIKKSSMKIKIKDMNWKW